MMTERVFIGYLFQLEKARNIKAILFFITTLLRYKVNHKIGLIRASW